jgi:hypothetical protein
VDEQTFSFAPPTISAVAAIKMAKVPASFQKAETVTFETMADASALTATVLDNVR